MLLLLLLIFLLLRGLLRLLAFLGFLAFFGFLAFLAFFAFFVFLYFFFFFAFFGFLAFFLPLPLFFFVPLRLWPFALLNWMGLNLKSRRDRSICLAVLTRGQFVSQLRQSTLAFRRLFRTCCRYHIYDFFANERPNDL